MRALPLLARILREPETCARLSLAEWDVLVRQARQTGLLARLHGRFSYRGLLPAVPLPARWHFDAATTLAQQQQIAVRWELGQIREALAALNFPLIALKGAAYIAADLPAARGRLFNDIDILVPRGLLNQVEAALMLAGWHNSSLSAYDERYYRRWMHEIPPMRHLRRGTVIDVHHAILPETARYFPDPDKLRAAIEPAAALPGVFVLSRTDRILHSATHLFHDGELPHGLRDLTDLDLLLRDAASVPGFWNSLVERAAELQLDRSLFYALRYTRHFLDTPVPDNVSTALRQAAPTPALLALMDSIFQRALAPIHRSCDDRYCGFARQAAYIRAHWLRMPSHLLLPHLFHKAFISPWQEEKMPQPQARPVA
jgi:hypothetical protein